jgi:hypothetical protein
MVVLLAFVGKKRQICAGQTFLQRFPLSPAGLDYFRKLYNMPDMLPSTSRAKLPISWSSPSPFRRLLADFA